MCHANILTATEQVNMEQSVLRKTLGVAEQYRIQQTGDSTPFSSVFAPGGPKLVNVGRCNRRPLSVLSDDK